MLLQTVYICSQNAEIYSVLPTNIAYFYIFCANWQNTREIRLKMMLNSIFTIEVNSFVGLFIAILKEQQGLSIREGVSITIFLKMCFWRGGIYNDFEKICTPYFFIFLRFSSLSFSWSIFTNFTRTNRWKLLL